MPSDPKYTWMMAKMYYNNADAAFHQSCTHLGKWLIQGTLLHGFYSVLQCYLFCDYTEPFSCGC